MSAKIVISGTGLWTPSEYITNDELVDSYNAHVDLYNQEHADQIASEELPAKAYSTSAFIEKASGIKRRYVYEKKGVLENDRMRPEISPRQDHELSHQAEIAVHAAKAAMKKANKTAADIDAVIVSSIYILRAYPAIAIEVQDALGIEGGFGFDMQVACSAATFGLQRAYEMVKSETAKCVLAINPELMSPQVNYKSRDSHFIFGDAAIATIVEGEESCTSEHAYEILSTRAFTKFSNNIRSNFGVLINSSDTNPLSDDQLFYQKGRAVFKEVCPMAAKHMAAHVTSLGLQNSDIKRWWLHQANINMNKMICKLLLDREPTAEEAPNVLDEFANTASAGSLIAFHRYQEDIESGDIGMICSFGAGYSIGSLVVRKV